MSFSGALVYMLLVVVALATGQLAAGLLGAIPMPVLLLWSLNRLRLYRQFKWAAVERVAHRIFTRSATGRVAALIGEARAQKSVAPA